MNITNSGMINDDGSAATGLNSSNKVINRIPKNNYTGEEIVGDDADKDMTVFDPCKYNRKNCKYCDVYGNCMYETCIFDMDENPPINKQVVVKCEICTAEFSVDTKEMKSYICPSCRSRILAAEKLPFTCMHCGKQQNHYSKWMFSRLCDECLDKYIFNDVCKNYDFGGRHAPA